MRSASAALIAKLAQEVPQKKLRVVFLINTYDAIIQTLRVRLPSLNVCAHVWWAQMVCHAYMPYCIWAGGCH